MCIEQEIIRHDTRGGLERAILDALLASGKGIERATVSNLSSVDEFHVGWQVATGGPAEHLGLERAMHLLDVRSGIGGPAHHFADHSRGKARRTCFGALSGGAAYRGGVP